MDRLQIKTLTTETLSIEFERFINKRRQVHAFMLDSVSHMLPPFLKQKDASVDSITEKIFSRLGKTKRQNFVWLVQWETKLAYLEKVPALNSAPLLEQSVLPLSHIIKIRLLGYAMSDGSAVQRGQEVQFDFGNRFNYVNLHNEFFYDLHPGYTVAGPRFRSHFNDGYQVWHFSCRLLTKTHPWFSSLKQWCYRGQERLTPPDAVLYELCPDVDSVNRLTAELFIWDGLLAYKKSSLRDLQGINRICLCLCNFSRVELERLANWLNGFNQPKRNGSKVISGFIWRVSEFKAENQTYLGLSLVLGQSNVTDFFQCIAPYVPADFAYKIPLRFQSLCRPTFQIQASHASVFGNLKQNHVDEAVATFTLLTSKSFKAWVEVDQEPGLITEGEIRDLVRQGFQQWSPVKAYVSTKPKRQLGWANSLKPEHKYGCSILDQFVSEFLTHIPDQQVYIGQASRHLNDFSGSRDDNLLYPAYVFWFRRQGFRTEGFLGPKAFLDTLIQRCPWAIKS